MLARIWAETDLLVAECLRRGVWDNLAPAELAAAASVVIYESRRDGDERGSVPRGPVADAIEAAGIAHKAGFTNSAATSDAPLGFLGDVFHTPAWLPIHNVFSVGDIEIVLGAFLLLHFVCGSRLARVPNRMRPAEA